MSPDSALVHHPVKPEQRYHILDVLRGFALFGILVINVRIFSGIALLMQARRAVGWMMLLAPVGRMALTNYLMQSVICIFIFYGFGLGLYGQLSVAAAVALMIPVYLVQVLYSTWWLRHFRFGPAEWLWRRLTYGVRKMG